MDEHLRRTTHILVLLLTAGCAPTAVFRGAVLVETKPAGDPPPSDAVETPTGPDDAHAEGDTAKNKPVLVCPEGAALVTYADRTDFFYVFCQRPDEVKHGPWLRIWKRGEGIVETGVMENGKKNGPYAEHRNDGSLIAEGAYIQDEPHGLWSEAYANGQKSESMSYDHGLREGPLLRWYEDGTPSEQTAYRKDLRHGEYKKWYENGRLQMTGTYVNGRPDGTFRTWSADGKPVGVVAVWRLGRVVSVEKVGR